MSYKIYRQKSKFYIVEQATGRIYKDDIRQMKINRSTINSTVFEFHSDDIGILNIDVADILSKNGRTFTSAAAFEYWTDRNTSEGADNESDLINHAAGIIFEDFGDVISVEEKAKDLIKFGENESLIAGGGTIMDLPATESEETFINTNGITWVVSTSGLDTMDIRLFEGHTIDGNNDFNFYKNTDGITLQGQTPVPLPTGTARANRARLSAKANGTISFYEGGAAPGGVVTDPTEVHLQITVGQIQSQKAATTISAADYYLLGNFTGSILEKNPSWCDFKIEIKPCLETEFYPITQNIGAADESGTVVFDSKTLLIVPKNHDVRAFGKPNAGGIFVSVGLGGLLAKIIE